MSIQHTFRPQNLALAIALALGFTELTNAQQLPEQAEPTSFVEVTQLPEATPTDPLTRLQAFTDAASTFTSEIDSPQPALRGVSVKPQDRDDLIIVKNGGSFEGRVDGGNGSNVIHLIGTDGGQLGNTRNVDSLYVSQGIWTATSTGDFKDEVAVFNDGILINNGKIKGKASVAGQLFNNNEIKGVVTVENGGQFAGKGTVGGLEVLGQLNIDRLQGAPRVKGNLNLSSTGVLAYEVSPDGHGETIQVSGTASLGDATLKIVAMPGDLPQSSEYTIIEAKKVTGEFGKIVNELAFMTATPHYDAKTVGLTYARNGLPIETFADSDNGQEVARSIAEPMEISLGLAPSDNAFTVQETLDTPVSPEPPAPITNEREVAQNIVDPMEIPQTPAPSSDNALTISDALNSPVGTDASPPASAPVTTAEIPPTAVAPLTTDKPVTAATPPAATQPVTTAPKPSSPTNTAVAVLLGSDKATAAHALEQLAAGNNANLAKATLNSDSPISATIISAMRQRDSAAVFGNQRNAPRVATGSEDHGRVWLQALGHGGTLDRDNDALKFSSQGLVLGADWSVDEQWRIGVLGGKSETRLDSRGLDGDLDSLHVGAYALRQDGPLSLRLGATYSNHDGNTKRRVAFKGFSDRPEGRYDANTQQAFAEAGYNLGRANVSIEPFAGLGYQRYQRDSYTEKGGAAALKVHSQSQNNLNSTIGLRLAKLNTLDNGMQLTPRFTAGWKHTFGDVESNTRQRLVTGGKDFTVSGAPLDRDSLLVDAGLDLGLSANQTLGVSLNSEFGTDSRNHGVTGQWRMSF
ncbi:outer membrane autotransporter protein [Pseudomonas corrugata]|uniref:autotransporter outer membrane beta-barrel domain-containing protein n=1 Tax=Pseudomonas corrugata TaxID=47879 RepID=UPI002865F99C|nr:autotransporter domain-containing protein [Pseudomonas corrugata]MDR7281384.1 outer membrane autotransporter protein [Pseudomonas corrugata]